MSNLRFILIGSPVDKCQQQETIADQQRHTAFKIKNYYECGQLVER